MQVIFDNGGGITLQTAEFAHHYDDGAHAGGDVKVLLDGGSTRDWDGNEPDDIHNGGYLVYDEADIREVLATGEIESSWGNVCEFFVALGVRVAE